MKVTLDWNLNFEIGFVFGKDAKRIWHEYYKDIKEITGSDWEPEPKDDGLVWMQAHEFMRIYGSHMGPGMYCPTNANVKIRVEPDSIRKALDVSTSPNANWRAVEVVNPKKTGTVQNMGNK